MSAPVNGPASAPIAQPTLVAVTSTGQVSGAERVLLRTLTAAVDAGWDVTCVCPAGPLAEQLRATGARHTVIPELNLADGPKPVAALTTIVRWLRAARTLRGAARTADVVLANALLSLPALRLARLHRPASRRVPALWLAHDVVVAPSRLRLYRWCSAALTTVVGVSEAVAVQLRTADGTGPVIEVVHNGVAFPVEPAHERRDGAVDITAEHPAVVGLNGLLTPWKGQQVLLDAVPLIEEPVRIEILGGTLPKDASYAAGLQRQVDRLGIADRVRILGHHPDPLARMRTWTVAVSASTDPEACPLAVLEAMSIGLPVVATDHGGSPEVLAGAGLLVPAGDETALAAAISRMVRSTSRREGSADRGLGRIATAHRLDRQTQRLLDVLASSAREGTRS